MVANHLELQSTPVVAISEKDDPPKDPLHAKPHLARRYAPLMDALVERGVGSIVLNGKDSYDPEADMFGQYFSLVHGEGEPRLMQIDNPVRVNAARDLSGGLARYTPIPSLNPEGIRNVTMSKHAQYEALSAQKAGDGLPQTFFVDPTDLNGISEALHAVKGEHVVLKPEKGRHGREVVIGSKAELALLISSYLTEREQDGLIVVQQYMPEISLPFASAGIKPLTDRDAYMMTRDGVRELRIHVIDEEPILAHGRVSEKNAEKQSGRDEFVFFDQDSIPTDALARAVSYARALRSATGDIDSYVAVDLTPDGSKLIEINGRNPAVIEIAGLAGDLSPHYQWVEGLARKLSSMALRGKAEG